MNITFLLLSKIVIIYFDFYGCYVNQTLHKRTIWDLKTTNWNSFNIVCDFGDFDNNGMMNEIEDNN